MTPAAARTSPRPRAYQRAHVPAALRGAALTGALAVVAYGLHRMSSAAWLAAACLATTLSVLGWRGGHSLPFARGRHGRGKTDLTVLIHMQVVPEQQ